MASEKRYRAQYPAGGKRRTISGKTRREVELKLRDALAINIYGITMEKRKTKKRMEYIFNQKESHDSVSVAN